HNLTVFLTLQHGFQPGTQSQRGFSGAGAATDGNDANRWVREKVERNALLSRAALEPESVHITAHKLHHAISHDPPQRGLLIRLQAQTAVHREFIDKQALISDEIIDNDFPIAKEVINDIR